MGTTVDLSKLKQEISSRKTQKNVDVNESGVMPKDQFLNGLVESLQTGRPTQASQTIKAIDVGATYKEQGKQIPQNLNTEIPQNNYQQAPPVKQNNDYGVERDQQLFEEFERKKREMLNGGAVNANKSQPHTTTYPQQVSQTGGNYINESALVNTVNEVVTNKFAIVVEQAMKDSIVEVYAKSRMRETIEESRELIREIVVDVIRDLQNQSKNKKKPQS